MENGPQPLRVALAQMNATVGDLDGNAARIGDLAARAREQGAQLVVFPELALTGYPPEDLLLKRDFLAAAGETLADLAATIHEIVALVGFPEYADDTYNSAAVLADGAVTAVYRKIHLPNYGVFDEARYFRPGIAPASIAVDGTTIGLTICEDIWEPNGPAVPEALSGAHAIVNLSASPYHAGKGLERERMLVQRARDNLAGVLFCNLVGGQDELVFDGHSLAIDQDGEVLARAPQFDEALTIVDFDAGPVEAARLLDTRHRSVPTPPADPPDVVARLDVPGATGDAAETEPKRAEPLGTDAEVYAALTLGVRDYVRKNGFERVVLGLSGGIDSALVALVAADALGADRVSCVIMPSRYSSEGTQADARSIAANLGTDVREIPIATAMETYETLLADSFAGQDADIAEENLQARIRGNLVMALSNKFGWLVLTTGNKSELSVGYATLYGDMAGGFAVLKDCFKGLVYRLVRWRNEQADSPLIPESVLERPPSAELRPDQRDEDSLPPYEILDAILAGYVEQDLSADELVRDGLPRDDVERVIRLVDLAEYKRRQAPPGIRISTKAFGRDRRLPITNAYTGRRREQSGADRLRAL